jgi:hypothetical protein
MNSLYPFKKNIVLLPKKILKAVASYYYKRSMTDVFYTDNGYNKKPPPA